MTEHGFRGTCYLHIPGRNDEDNRCVHSTDIYIAKPMTVILTFTELITSNVILHLTTVYLLPRIRNFRSEEPDLTQPGVQ